MIETELRLQVFPITVFILLVVVDVGRLCVRAWAQACFYVQKITVLLGICAVNNIKVPSREEDVLPSP